jgi:hypothetical protein
MRHIPNMSDFLLDLHPSLAHQGFVKIRTEPTGMLAVFIKPYAYDLGTSLRKQSLNSGYNFLQLILTSFNSYCTNTMFVSLFSNAFRKAISETMINVIPRIAIGVIYYIISSAIVLANQNGRIVPSGIVTMHANGQKIGEYRAEAPLPFNTLLSCQKDCAANLSDVNFVAQDKTWFEVKTSENAKDLFVKKGTILFNLTAVDQSLSFSSPEGTLKFVRIIAYRSFETTGVKGYLTVAQDGGSQLCLVEGRAAFINSAGDEKIIESGECLEYATPRMLFKVTTIGAAAVSLAAMSVVWAQFIEDDTKIASKSKP